MGGNDLIVTGAGDDVLDGGVGDDILEGGTGIDTYRFEYGSGHDTIIETGLTESSIIEIGSGVSLADLDITHDGDHLRLGILGSETSLTYLDWRHRRDVAPLEVRFNDGMQLTETELELKIKTGTDSADTLRSNRRAERLLGHGGDDTLLAKGGDDVLVGGSGNDLLDGGDGSDSYLFTTGSGSDRIVESSDDAISVDRVVFGSGTNPIDLYFSRSGEDLLVEQLNSDDQITIIGWYGSSGASIEQFSAADGSLIAGSEIDQLIESMASFTSSSGMDWSSAVSQQPDEVRTLLADYWANPTSATQG
jgi:Ca2+-binding RTX toxin-like protein